MALERVFEETLDPLQRAENLYLLGLLVLLRAASSGTHLTFREFEAVGGNLRTALLKRDVF